MHLAVIKQNDSISASFWNTSLWYVRISGSGSRIAELFAHIRITPITEITPKFSSSLTLLFLHFFSIELPSLWGAAWTCAHLCLHTMGRCTTSLHQDAQIHISRSSTTLVLDGTENPVLCKLSQSSAASPPCSSRRLGWAGTRWQPQDPCTYGSNRSSSHCWAGAG